MTLHVRKPRLKYSKINLRKLQLKITLYYFFFFKFCYTLYSIYKLNLRTRLFFINEVPTSSLHIKKPPRYLIQGNILKHFSYATLYCTYNFFFWGGFTFDVVYIVTCTWEEKIMIGNFILPYD